MPVVTIKSKPRTNAAAAHALSHQIQKKTEHLLDTADRVLVVYEPSGSANIYYEGGSKPSTGAN